MENQPLQILDHASVQHRLKRMAFEIYEAHYGEEELLIIGIDERGGYIAQALVDLLAEISPLSLVYIQAHLDRETNAPAIGIELEASVEDLYEKPLLVVDDVLFKGSTLLNVVSILLHAFPKTIRTAVLIDRGHRSLPIASDITGLTLATTIKQYVTVEIKDDQISAYLA
ncbi:MAG: phosphoribosyltransferase family protein [Bacteroidota bacterium]